METIPAIAISSQFDDGILPVREPIARRTAGS